MEQLGTAVFWVVLGLIQALPLVALAALAKAMHGSVVVSLGLAAAGVLVYADLWTYRRLDDDALNGFYFVLFPAYIAAGVIGLAALDILLRRYRDRSRRPDRHSA